MMDGMCECKNDFRNGSGNAWGSLLRSDQEGMAMNIAFRFVPLGILRLVEPAPLRGSPAWCWIWAATILAIRGHRRWPGVVEFASMLGNLNVPLRNQAVPFGGQNLPRG